MYGLFVWITLVLAQDTLANPEQIIVGGEEARPPGSYPWQGRYMDLSLNTWQELGILCPYPKNCFKNSVGS